MLHADDADIRVGITWKLRGKVVEVIVKVCTVFGLAVSEAKMEITCLQ